MYYFLETAVRVLKLHSNSNIKKIQLGGFLGRYFGLLMEVSLLLIKNFLQPIPKSVLIPLELTTSVTAVDEIIHKKPSWFELPIRLSKVSNNICYIK